MGMGWTAAALTVAVMGLIPLDRAVASEPEAMAADERMFDFSVCNRARSDASVALSARLAPGSSDFVVAGWWKVAPGTCRKIGSYPRGHFYMHASAGGSTWGKGDLNLCVETPGPFKRINMANYKCASNALRKFSHADVKSAKWEWTLTP